jgi:hypothetical protein
VPARQRDDQIALSKPQKHTSSASAHYTGAV